VAGAPRSIGVGGERGGEPFFGLPVRMSRADAERLLAALAEAWEDQYGPLRTVSADLNTMHRKLFKPIARESTLREAIKQAAQAGANADLPEALRLDVGGAHVITPEGRVAIEVLERALDDQSGELLELADRAVAAERLLLQTYRHWCRERLHRVVAMAAGEDAPLLPAALGLVIMLLIEGAIGAGAALVQARGVEPDVFERSIIAGVAAFALAVDAAAEWDERHFSLYGGYALTEARRRLQALVLEPPTRRPSPAAPAKRVYIQEGERDAVIGFIGRDLQRRGIGPNEIRQALGAALDAYGHVAEPERAQRARERARCLLVALSADESAAEAEGAPP
jgi:hypothetical protein